MSVEKVVAVVGIAVSVAFAAACGDSGSGSAQTRQTANDAPQSESLPAGFPASVPVVPGPYRAYDTGVAGSSGLEVVDADDAAFDAAVAKLTGAGYTTLSDPSPKGAKRRTASFVDKHYKVSLEAQSSGGYRLIYRVTELDNGK
ncbi:MAG: hypothetical protein QM658_17865 [Gordonia sp. (in: high G+C Gram-positive bacteria)]